MVFVIKIMEQKDGIVLDVNVSIKSEAEKAIL